MKLYNYAPSIATRTSLTIDQIPSSEFIHLTIAHEVDALDRALDGITVFDYSKETMAYCCGKLGISVEQYQTLSTEDFKDMLKNAKQKIQALWVKITGYYKKNYAKISIYFMDLFKKYSKLTDDFRAIRNKHKIGISPSTQDLLFKHFGYLGPDFINHMGHLAEHLTSIVKDLTGSMFQDPINLKESISVRTTFGKYVKDLIEKQGNVEGQVLCITYCCHNNVRYIYNGKALEEDNTSTEDDNNNNKGKPKVDPSKILQYGELKLNSESRSKEEYVDINFDPVLKLAKDNDTLRDKVKDFSKAIQELEKKCASATSSSSDTSAEHFRNIFLMSTKLTMDTTYNILDNLKSITKCLKAIRDDAVNTSFYAYYLYKEMVNEKKVIMTPNGDIIQTVSDVEVVEDGDKIYIDLNDNWDAVIEKTGLMGGLAIVNFNFEGIENANQELDDDSAAMVKGNLIFLDRKLRGPKSNLNLIKNSGMTLDFIYYHEEGHVVTGQDEIPLVITDTYTDIDKRYFNHVTENSADAYACRKTGVSPSQLAEWRAKLGNQLIANNKEEFIKNIERYKGDVSTWKINNDGTPSKK